MTLGGLDIVGPTIVGLLLALAMIAGPGAALAAAIFPHPTIGRVERTLVAGTIGIAALVLGGLLLDLLPGGLTLRTWFGYLLLVTDGACLVILIRSARPPSRAPGAAHNRRALAAWVPRLGGAAFGMPTRDLVLIACGVAIAVGALAFSTMAATDAPRTSFTQLWLIPDPAGSAQVLVGVENMEDAPTVYSLEVREADRVIGSWPRIDLQPGERWERVVAVVTKVGALPLEAVLERADAPGVPYRRVSIAQEPSGSPDGP